jgi:hypothetical protein
MSTLPIWLFWEGPCPPYIALCLDIVRAHHPEARILDQRQFDSLWRHDRDLDLSDLGLHHVADFARAYLLAHEGGLYIDADCLLMRPLHPLLEAAAAHGFVGYREPDGYMSNNFIAASAESAVARDLYARIVARLREGTPLEWLDIGSAQVDKAIAACGRDALLLATSTVMPLGWQDSPLLAERGSDEEHRGRLAADCWCYMLSNNTIKSRPQTEHFMTMERGALLADDSFLGFLMREARRRAGG